MRLDLYGQFVVSVITPRGGWSKGRPLAFIEDGEGRYPAELLIPNDLNSSELACYVASKYATFAQPGKEIRRLDPIRHAA